MASRTVAWDNIPGEAGFRIKWGPAAVVLASDTFDRANAATLGSNWTGNEAGFQIVSNAAVTNNVNSDADNYYSAITWPADQYSEVTLGTVAAAALDVGYAVGIRDSTSGAKTYYRAVGNSSGYEVRRFIAGASLVLASSSGTTFASGDKLRLAIVGSTWRLYKNGTQIATGTDTGISAGASAISYSSTYTGSIASWEGGSFGGNYTLSADVAADVTNYSIGNLTPGVTYNAIVVGLDADGQEGVVSDEIIFTATSAQTNLGAFGSAATATFSPVNTTFVGGALVAGPSAAVSIVGRSTNAQAFSVSPAAKLEAISTSTIVINAATFDQHSVALFSAAAALIAGTALSATEIAALSAAGGATIGAAFSESSAGALSAATAEVDNAAAASSATAALAVSGSAIVSGDAAETSTASLSAVGSSQTILSGSFSQAASGSFSAEGATNIAVLQGQAAATLTAVGARIDSSAWLSVAIATGTAIGGTTRSAALSATDSASFTSVGLAAVPVLGAIASSAASSLSMKGLSGFDATANIAPSVSCSMVGASIGDGAYNNAEYTFARLFVDGSATATASFGIRPKSSLRFGKPGRSPITTWGVQSQVQQHNQEIEIEAEAADETDMVFVSVHAFIGYFLNDYY